MTTPSPDVRRYPQAMLDAIRRTTYGRKVLDVGIGTGNAAQAFADLGYLVTGVEPDPRLAMRARDRGFAVEEGRFEDWNPDGRWFDLVIAGQSWHVIDPLAGANKAADATRPAGRIAVFWNIAEADLDAWAETFERAEAGFTASGRYTAPQRWRFDWTDDADPTDPVRFATIVVTALARS